MKFWTRLNFQLQQPDSSMQIVYRWVSEESSFIHGSGEQEIWAGIRASKLPVVVKNL